MFAEDMTEGVVRRLQWGCRVCSECLNMGGSQRSTWESGSASLWMWAPGGLQSRVEHEARKLGMWTRVGLRMWSEATGVWRRG